MMAQEMYEENKVLQSEIDALKSLIESWIPEMTPQILVMNDINKMREEFEEAIQSLPSSEMDEDECCEECLMFIDDCK